MPTGYTAELMEKGMEFKPFVLQCARQFGALITMRDDPNDTPIPDEFIPSDYHIKELENAKKEHARLQAMTKEEKIAFGEQEKTEEIKQQFEYLKKEKAANERLTKMKSQVLSWHPPTHDHDELKKFMLNQIEISMNDLSYNHRSLQEAKEKPPIAYYVAAVSSAQWSITYHTDENRKEIERVKSRTDWVKQLKASL